MGIQITNTLSWTAQVDQQLKKCNKNLYLLQRIKQYIDIPTRKLFFNAYILPHIDYCSTIWGNCTTTCMNKVIKFQKRAARIILNKSFDHPSDELFKELNWMTFIERIEYKKSLIVFKCLRQLGPGYLNEKFQIHTNNNR